MTWITTQSYYTAQFLFTLYMPIILYSYWQRRGRIPIQAWNPMSTTLSYTALVVALWLGIAMEIFWTRTTAPFWFLVLISGTIAVDGFVLQLVTLHAKSKLTKIQVVLAGEQRRRFSFSNDSGSFSRGQYRRLGAIWFWSAILTRRAAILFVIANLSAVAVPALALFWRHPLLITVSAFQCRHSSYWSGCLVYIDVTIAKLSLSLFTTWAIAFLLRAVDDPYGVKRGLLFSIISYSIGTFLYAASFQFDINDWNWAVNLFLAGSHVSFWIGVVAPFRTSFLPIYTNFNANGAALLDQFLVRPKRFNAFLSFLESEFAVENLLFWRAALEYHIRCVRSASAIAEGKAPTTCVIDGCQHLVFADGESLRIEAVRIYETYIVSGSPCQINIASDVAGQLSRRFSHIEPGQGDDLTVPTCQEGLIDSTLFEDARSEIVQLLNQDSLSRFKLTTTGRRMWKRFMDNRGDPDWDGESTREQTVLTITL